MKKHIFIILFAFISILQGCNEDFMDIKNPNAFDATTFYVDASSCERSVDAIYTIMLHKGMFSRDWYFNFDLLGNEAGPLAPLQGPIAELSRSVYDATNDPITSMWDRLYRMILRANYSIEVTSKWVPANDVDLALQSRYIGEAKFFLGFAYYHLASLWGDVPLRTSFTETATYLNCARSSAADVFAFAEQNLIDAAAALPGRYGNADNGRATKWAAKAFLAKIYLMQGQWTTAQPILKDIVDNGGYIMESGIQGFENEFLDVNRNSTETIFDCKFAWYGWGNASMYHMFDGTELWGTKGATSGRAMEYGFMDWGNVNITSSAVKKFKYDINSTTGYVDPRAAYTFYGDGGYGGDMDILRGPYAFDVAVTDADGTQSPYGWRWKKYQEYDYLFSENDPRTGRDGGPASEISTVITRLADIKLLYAECLIQANDLAGALTQINDVRTRAGATNYTSLGDKTQGMVILKRERELELCGEQQRWFDLLRWHRNGKIFDMIQILNDERTSQGHTAGFTEKHLLLPIPQNEKDVNKLCEVSNGWN
jgi:starch-binding outer membrane protein, SusD/RagB family